MTNFANGDSGSERAYNYYAEQAAAEADAASEWMRENGPFETEEEADAAYADAKAEWQDELYREEDRYSVADYIRDEQEAMLDAMESSMGIEPRGWEDSY